MKDDSQIYFDILATLSRASGAAVRFGSQRFISWLVKNHIPQVLIDLFSTCVPEKEIWAGSGTFFGESSIIAWKKRGQFVGYHFN